MTPLVEFAGAGVEFAGGGRALDGLTLAVAAGEVLALLGRSGSGKTTALRLVNALVAPSSGEVRVAGRATSAWDPIALRRRCGYVIQEAGLFPHLTVARNVAMVPELEGWERARIDRRTAELLDLVGLAPGRFASRLPGELSGGQKQRVGVARALAADPPLLLLDEPFGALDPVTRRELQHEFRALATRLGKTAIFVTHDLVEAARVADRVALLDRGRLAVHGTFDELAASRHAEARAFVASAGFAPSQATAEGLRDATATASPGGSGDAAASTSIAGRGGAETHAAPSPGFGATPGGRED